MIIPGGDMHLNSYLRQFACHHGHTVFSQRTVHIYHVLALHVDQSTLQGEIYTAVDFTPMPFSTMVLSREEKQILIYRNVYCP